MVIFTKFLSVFSFILLSAAVPFSPTDSDLLSLPSHDLTSRGEPGWTPRRGFWYSMLKKQPQVGRLRSKQEFVVVQKTELSIDIFFNKLTEFVAFELKAYNLNPLQPKVNVKFEDVVRIPLDESEYNALLLSASGNEMVLEGLLKIFISKVSGQGALRDPTSQAVALDPGIRPWLQKRHGKA